jgi:hypothetical protein
MDRNDFEGSKTDIQYCRAEKAAANERANSAESRRRTFDGQ